MLLLKLLLGNLRLASLLDAPYTEPYSDTTCMAGSRPGCNCQLRATLSNTSESSRATAACGNALPLTSTAQITGVRYPMATSIYPEDPNYPPHYYTLLAVEASDKPILSGLAHGGMSRSSPILSQARSSSRLLWLVSNIDGSMLAGDGVSTGSVADGPDSVTELCGCFTKWPTLGYDKLCSDLRRQRSAELCKATGTITVSGQPVDTCTFSTQWGCRVNHAFRAYDGLCNEHRRQTVALCSAGVEHTCGWQCYQTCGSLRKSVGNCTRVLHPYRPPTQCSRLALLLFRQSSRHVERNNASFGLFGDNADHWNTDEWSKAHNLTIVAANWVRVGDNAMCSRRVETCHTPPKAKEAKQFTSTPVFTFDPNNVADAVLGFIVGPVICVYGLHLPAVVVLFNALWASGLRPLLTSLSRMSCPLAFTPPYLVQIYDLVISGALLCFASLKGAAFGKMLRVGVIANEFSNALDLLLRPAAERGEAWAISCLGFGTLISVACACSLVLGKWLAITVAFGVALAMGSLQAVIPNVSNYQCDAAEIEAFGTDRCVPPNHTDVRNHFNRTCAALGPDACTPTIPFFNQTTIERWNCRANVFGNFFVRYMPVIIPALAVYFYATRKEKFLQRRRAALSRGSLPPLTLIERIDGSVAQMTPDFVKRSLHRVVTGGVELQSGPKVTRQDSLIVFNCAMVGSSLFASAILAVIQTRYMDKSDKFNVAAITVCIQFFLVAISVFLGFQQENFEQGAPVTPKAMTIVVALLVAARMTVVKPLLLLNNFLYKVATGKVPNPYKDKEEEDKLMHQAMKRKTEEQNFGKTLSAKNLGIHEGELGPGSLAKAKCSEKNEQMQMGKGKKGKGKKGKGKKGKGKGANDSAAMIL